MSVMDKIVRERQTEERVRKLDAHEIVDIIHAFEDNITSLEEHIDRLSELVTATQIYCKDHNPIAGVDSNYNYLLISVEALKETSDVD